MSGTHPAFLVFVPALSGLCLVGFGPRRWGAGPAFAAALVCLAVLAGTVALAAGLAPEGGVVGGWPEPLGIRVELDRMGALVVAVAAVVIGLACLYAAGEGGYDAKFHGLMLVLLAGAVGLCGARDLFNAFVWLELVSIVACILIAYRGGRRAVVAAFDYLMASGLGMVFFLVGVALVYRQVGTLAMSDLAGFAGRGPVLRAGAALCVAGVGLKAALAPLHVWLPAAHGEAPTPVSATLSGVMVKASFVAMARLLGAFDIGFLGVAVMVLGAAGAVGAALLTLAQSDPKRLLAYSTVSQMGVVLAALGAGATGAALAHACFHAAFKSLLFLCAGYAIALSGTRDISKMGGLLRVSPAMGVALLVGAAAMSGVPGTSGFLSKSAVAGGVPAAVFAALLLAAAGTAAAMARLCTILFGSGRRAPVCEPLTGFRFVPLVVLAAGCIAPGVLPGPAMRLFGLGPPVEAGALPSAVAALLLGVATFLLTRSAWWRAASRLLRRREPTLGRMLFVVYVATAALAAGSVFVR